MSKFEVGDKVISIDGYTGTIERFTVQEIVIVIIRNHTYPSLSETIYRRESDLKLDLQYHRDKLLKKLLK